MKILLIDNYDSFTYNLLHLIKSACDNDDSVDVCPGDRLAAETAAGYDRIVISPGPGTPSEAKKLHEIIRGYEQQTPIFGICLGHQIIAESYGAVTYNLTRPAHGIQSEISITDHTDIFRGMEGNIVAGRYHSWCVSSENLPDCLKITAADSAGNIMAISHCEYNIFGVQFHPESFMTYCGKTIMSNFLNIGTR
ncbi:aminodeoxychorismate/anthranilate synthase component II [Alistipes sp. OttesenSCG-928-B03]|nr:aminodeoxychorismate/anthranilate synthase component II [Alistipes sp. OttesenSCG-928-B03]